MRYYGVGDEIASDSDIRCPLCDSETEIRKGKWSWFHGCMRYPLCNGKVTFNKAARMREESDSVALEWFLEE